MSALRPGDITDEMIQAMDTFKRQGLQKDLHALATNIRADAEGRYDGAEPGWRAGVEWTLLWIENTRQPADRRPAVGHGAQRADGQGVSPE
ncbi:hypothetical protein OHT68_49075 (plasmid) [Streptomyces canus]|uniref:hypothetical protein n=1 Tax=Streptomyces canus TaxID=58343 RepID=UPI002E2BDD65|nr:hypothetical protein [Streptomyces canus]